MDTKLKLEFDRAEILQNSIISWGRARRLTKTSHFCQKHLRTLHSASNFWGFLLLLCFFFSSSLRVVLICMFLAPIIYKSSKCCFIRVSCKLWCPRSLGALFYVLIFFWTRKLCFAKSKWNSSLKRFEFCLQHKTHKFSTSSPAWQKACHGHPRVISLWVLFGITVRRTLFYMPKDFPWEKKAQTDHKAEVLIQPRFFVRLTIKIPYKVGEVKQEDKREISQAACSVTFPKFKSTKQDITSKLKCLHTTWPVLFSLTIDFHSTKILFQWQGCKPYS